MNRIPLALRVSLIAICAALYAALGYASYLGLFTPVIGVVRFWPVVFVPAVFSLAFDPLIGGLGAAIGIFISDMIIHGNALLSLWAGVPANFMCFFISGLRGPRRKELGMIIGAIINFLVVALCLLSGQLGLLPEPIAVTYALATAVALAIPLVMGIKVRKWMGYYAMGSLGLLIGASWIGIMVWAFSQIFVLPSGEMRLPLMAALAWMLWVYCTEIPFMLLLPPPVVEALRRGLPPGVVRREEI